MAPKWQCHPPDRLLANINWSAGYHGPYRAVPPADAYTIRVDATLKRNRTAGAVRFCLGQSSGRNHFRFGFPAFCDSLIAAWAAAKRAIGTRKGEQLT